MTQVFKLRPGKARCQLILGKARCGEPFIDRILAGMPEWRVSDIMRKTCCLHHVTDIGHGGFRPLGQVFDDMRACHQAKRLTDRADLDRVGQAGMDMIVFG